MMPESVRKARENLPTWDCNFAFDEGAAAQYDAMMEVFDEAVATGRIEETIRKRLASLDPRIDK